MEIKFGDIQYFTLLSMQDMLKRRDFERLDLVNYEKLKMEVDLKIAQIHKEDMERRNKKSNT